MNSVFIAIGAGVLYVIAYHTYGRFLGQKIFKISKDHLVPSIELEDDVDFIPTRKDVLFGHHFASIAGTGPIVGPAIAIIWGWLPALIWILVGSVVMGAVHDFGTLVVSMRNQGRSVGDLAGDLISPRTRLLFQFIIFFLLLIVVAIFGVVIAACFKIFPATVLPIWCQIPIAVTLGYLVYKKKMNALLLGFIAVCIMYGTVWLGTYVPFEIPTDAAGKVFGPFTPVSIWVIVLLIYAYIASILPVQVLLQPRDYINAFQLIVAMALLVVGVLVAHPVMVAPAVNHNLAADVPKLFPLLFVTIACGAISGFHSLVSSGTSSKQCGNEMDAKCIGYGSMLTEGMLAVFVIIACGAGVGLGYEVTLKEGGKEMLMGTAAFNHHYASWAGASGLAAKITAFVVGAKNMIAATGLSPAFATTIMGCFIVAFAATTLDTATRVQRYVVGEIATACKVPVLANKYIATFIAVGSAFLLAFVSSPKGMGTGAMVLWPLFGCCNQLLAGLALLVVTVYLAKKRIPIIFTALPMVFMVGMTGWAMVLTVKKFLIFDANGAFDPGKTNWMLFIIGIVIMFLEIWMIIESAIVLKKAYFAPETIGENTDSPSEPPKDDAFRNFRE